MQMQITKVRALKVYRAASRRTGPLGSPQLQVAGRLRELGAKGRMLKGSTQANGEN